MKSSKFNSWFIFLLVAVLFPLYGFLAVPSLQAQTNVDIAQAKKEGRVGYYTSQNMAGASALAKSFEKKYPFIKVDLFRMGGTTLRTRVLAEAQAGRHSFDVISMNIMDIQLLMKMTLLAKYRSPEAKGLPEGQQVQEI